MIINSETTLKTHTFKIGKITLGSNNPCVLIAGPCQIESHDHAMGVASALKEICQKAQFQLIFKSSFDKANRTSLKSQRGVGFEKGLSILQDIRQKLNIPTLTDIHFPEQCHDAAQAVDVLQIPAFLCRQTDLLLAAGQTQSAILVKKGQFLAPWDMKHIIKKITSTGNKRILLCERGTSFGYGNLVNDMRSFPIMAQTGFPVVFDATHSVQQPASLGNQTGGQREFAPILARAALAIGISALFMETHPHPEHAPSDGATMIPLSELPHILPKLKQIDMLTKG